MAGPTVLGNPGGGLQALMQGSEATQNLAKFIEGKRQFDEEQKRLNRMQKAQWGWQMVNELIKTTETNSIRGVAEKYPELLSLVYQASLDLDPRTAMAFTTTLAQGAFNALESMNANFTMLSRYGSGELEDPSVEINRRVAEIAKMQEASEKKVQPSGSGPAPAPTKTTVTTGETPTAPRPAGEVTTRATEGLDDLKTRLFYAIRRRHQATEGYSTAEATPDETRGILEDYISKNPAAKEQVLSWWDTSFPAFVSDVQAGRYYPPAGTAKPVETAPAPSAAHPPQTTVTKEKQFAMWMKEKGFLKADPNRMSPADVLTLPERNRARWKQFEGELARGGVELAMEPVTVSAKAPEGKAEEPSPEIMSALDELAAAVMGGNAGQRALKAKKLEGPMTYAIMRNLEKTPEGIEQLRQNSNYEITNPETIKYMALIQSPASVYATDAELKSKEKETAAKWRKAEADAEKAQVDLAKAKVDLARAGIAFEKDKLELVRYGLVQALMTKGTVVPPEVSSQVMEYVRSMEEAERKAEEARAKGDKKGMDLFLAERDKWKTLYATTMKAVVEGLAGSDSPDVQKWAKLLKTVEVWKPGELFWGLVKRASAKAGTIVETSTEETAPTKPSMTQDAEDILESEGF